MQKIRETKSRPKKKRTRLVEPYRPTPADFAYARAMIALAVAPALPGHAGNV